MTITVTALGEADTLSLASGGTNTISATLPVGSTIVVIVTAFPTSFTVTDNAAGGSNTYSSLEFASGNVFGATILAATNIKAATSITFTNTDASTCALQWIVAKLTSSGSYEILPDTATYTAFSGTTPSVKSGTPAHTNEAFIAGFSVNLNGTITYNNSSNFAAIEPVQTRGTSSESGAAYYVAISGAAPTFAPTSSAGSEAWDIALVGFYENNATVANPVVTTLKAPTQAGTLAEVEPGAITTKLKTIAQINDVTVTDPIVSTAIADSLPHITQIFNASENTGGAIIVTNLPRFANIFVGISADFAEINTTLPGFGVLSIAARVTEFELDHIYMTLATLQQVMEITEIEYCSIAMTLQTLAPASSVKTFQPPLSQAFYSYWS